MIGPELTANYFLQPFCHLSTSSVFHTRKACATNIADLANVVSVAEVEKYLLPHFVEFLKDQVWAIRKVCADLFSSFALRCTRKTRETVLTECFVRLLDDNSRWVKISAYKSLGPFISTFIPQKSDESDADEKESGEEQTASNNVSLLESDVSGEPSTPPAAASELDSPASPSAVMSVDEQEQEQQDAVVTSSSNILPLADESGQQSSPPAVDTAPVKQEESAKAETEPENEYSNFVYWRNSLPSLEDSLITTAASGAATSTGEAEKARPTAVDKTNNVNQKSGQEGVTPPVAAVKPVAPPPPPSTTASSSASETTLTGLLNSTNLLEKIINSKSNDSTNFYSSIASFYNSNNQHQQQQSAQKTLEQLTSELKQVFSTTKKNTTTVNPPI